MSDSTDRILELIDSTLQSSSGPAAGGLCARCERQPPAVGGEVCVGCRAWLAGDSDHHPTRHLDPDMLERYERAQERLPDLLDQVRVTELGENPYQFELAGG